MVLQSNFRIRKLILSIWCYFFFLFLFKSIVSAEVIEYLSYTPNNFEEIYHDNFKHDPVQLSGELILPEGLGKFPVVVLQHGTGDNKKKWYKNLANELKKNNIGTFINDSYTNRNISGADLTLAPRVIDGLFLLNCIKSIGKLDKIGCCYTVEFEDFSEGEYASQIANYFGLKHKIISYSKQEFFKSLQKNINSQEGPIGGLMNCGLSYLAKRVRKDGFKTILGGMALDELFGGYDIFSKDLIKNHEIIKMHMRE